MNIKQAGVSLAVVFGLVASVWGAQEVIQSEIDERVSEVRANADRSVSFVQAAHRLDFYESKTEVAEKHLELLRAVNAPAHKIQAAEKEVDFWRREAHEARKAVTQ